MRAALGALALALLPPLSAQPTLTALPAGFTSRVIATGLRAPTGFAFSPHSDDLFVCEAAGRLVAFAAATGYAAPTLVLDLGASAALDTAGERGLQAVAFPPNDTRTLFVSYTQARAGAASRNVIAAFAFDPATRSASLASERLVFAHDALSAALTHNANALFFHGVDDGGATTLFAGHGDNMDAESAQRLASTHGKILRLRVDGTAAAGNPFAARADVDAAHATIFALGLRNPFAAFAAPVPSSTTYAGPLLFTTDVGDWHAEEVNVLSSGLNGGWPLCEGTATPQGPEGGMGPCSLVLFQGEGTYTSPVFAYGHFLGSANLGSPVEDSLGCAISAATVYAPAPSPLDAAPFPASFTDSLFLADYCNGEDVAAPAGGWLRALPMGRGSRFDTSGGRVTGPGAVFALGLTENNVGLAVGPPVTGPAIFLLSRGRAQTDDGSITAISFVPAGPPTIGLQPRATVFNLNDAIQPSLAVSASGAPPLSFAWQTLRDGDQWAVAPNANGPVWTPLRATWATLGSAARCVVTNALGEATSMIVAIAVSAAAPPTVSVTSESPLTPFSGGDVLEFAAVASGNATIEWTALFQHAHHAHPLATGRGATFTVAVPRVGENSANVSISVTARARDALTGLTATSPALTRAPRLGAFVLVTAPASLVGAVLLDGSAAPASATVGVAGMLRDVSAAARAVGVGGVILQFTRWSDGVVGRARTLTVLGIVEPPAVLTAIFDEVEAGASASPTVAASATATTTGAVGVAGTSAGGSSARDGASVPTLVGAAAAAGLAACAVGAWICIRRGSAAAARQVTVTAAVVPRARARTGVLSPSMRLRSPVAGGGV